MLHLIKGDIRDEELLDKIFKQSIEKGKNIDGVIHFSGLKSIKISKSNPLEYWDNNVRGTISLVKIMEKYNCRNLIFSSSASVYGESGISPFKEADELNPISPYGNTKLAIENVYWILRCKTQ